MCSHIMHTDISYHTTDPLYVAHVFYEIANESGCFSSVRSQTPPTYSFRAACHVITAVLYAPVVFRLAESCLSCVYFIYTLIFGIHIHHMNGCGVNMLIMGSFDEPRTPEKVCIYSRRIATHKVHILYSIYYM